MQGYNRVPTPRDTDVLGARAGALIIDGIVTGVLFYGMIFLFGAVGAAGDAGSIVGLGFLLGIALSSGYGLLLEGLWDGYTVGKKVLGIKVVKEDGSPITIVDSLIRNLLLIVDQLPFFYILGLILISSSDISQRLGDRVAGTVVVTDSPAQAAAPQQQGQYQQGRQQGQYQQGQQGQYQQGQQNRRQQGGQQRQGGQRQQQNRRQGGQRRQNDQRDQHSDDRR